MIYNSIEGYLELKPRHYRFLKALRLNRKISQIKSYGYDVELVLSKCSGEADEDLLIRCANASDIKIGNVEGMPGLLVNIEDVSLRQLEGCNYRIVEQEEDAFSFNCEEFFVELIKQ